MSTCCGLPPPRPIFDHVDDDAVHARAVGLGRLFGTGCARFGRVVASLDTRGHRRQVASPVRRPGAGPGCPREGRACGPRRSRCAGLGCRAEHTFPHDPGKAPARRDYGARGGAVRAARGRIAGTGALSRSPTRARSSTGSVPPPCSRRCGRWRVRFSPGLVSSPPRKCARRSGRWPGGRGSWPRARAAPLWRLRRKVFPGSTGARWWRLSRVATSTRVPCERSWTDTCPGHGAPDSPPGAAGRRLGPW